MKTNARRLREQFQILVDKYDHAYSFYEKQEIIKEMDKFCEKNHYDSLKHIRFNR